MSARNMAELERDILNEIKKAMQVTSSGALADMYEETGDFYSQGEPVVYQRTGAIGDTPRTTALSKGGNSVSFEAYLDTSHTYTTGSNPNMQQVLELANYGIPFTTKNGKQARPTVGKKGFWERIEKKIEKRLEDTMGKFFK